jgi:hypothetical protein
MEFAGRHLRLKSNAEVGIDPEERADVSTFVLQMIWRKLSRRSRKLRLLRGL